VDLRGTVALSRGGIDRQFGRLDELAELLQAPPSPTNVLRGRMPRSRRGCTSGLAGPVGFARYSRREAGLVQVASFAGATASMAAIVERRGLRATLAAARQQEASPANRKRWWSRAPVFMETVRAAGRCCCP